MNLKQHQIALFKKELYASLTVLAVLVFVFSVRLINTPLSTWQTIASFIGFAMLISAYLLQINPIWLKVAGADADDNKKNILLYPAYLWAITVVYALMTSQTTWQLFVIGLGYCLLPAIMMFIIYKKPAELSLADALLVILLWFPIEFGLLPNIGIPPVQSVISVYHIAAIVLVIYLYFGVRKLPNVGLTFRLKGNDWRTVIQYFIFFMPIALVIGFATDFIALSDRGYGTATVFASFVGIALFIALPEEILFRGVIQNLIEKKLANKTNGTQIALIVTAVIFGFAHGNNNNPPFIDIPLGPLGTWHMPWVYIVLATVAGYFYGLTFIKTRKVTAAAVVHLLVDWVWSTFFSG